MSDASKAVSRPLWAVEVAFIAIFYVLGARLRLFFPFTAEGASWVWIPSGLSLAALLLRGRDRWPGVALGAFVSSMLADAHLPSALMATLYAPAESLLAIWLMRWRGEFDRALQSVGAVQRFVGGVLAAAAVTAVAGAVNLTQFTPGVNLPFDQTWVTFWVGDALAMLTVTPVLIIWAGATVRFGGRWRRVEFAALLASSFIVGSLVFGQHAWPVHLVLPIAYMSFPLLVWGAFRFGQPGVTAVTALVATLALVGSGRGFGPFAHAVTRAEAVLVAGFMSVVGVTALMLAALVQERARAQSQRRASERRFRAFMQHSPAIAFMKGSDGRYLFGNGAWAAQFGRSPEALLGLTDFDLWSEEIAARFQASDRQALSARHPIEVLESGELPSGQQVWYTTLKFVVDQDDGPPLIGGIALDITLRVRAEQALRASEDRYRSLVELAGSVIVVVGPDGLIVEFNREAEAFFGIPRAEALGRDYLETCVADAQRAAVAADLARLRAGDAVHGRESTFVQRDGLHKSFLWNATGLVGGGEGAPILVIGQDISELRRLEHQLLLAQRMEGIGRLAGGIAHDFNNLLTAILGHAEMAQDDVAPTDPARGNIAEITRAAQRAADLTRQLLAFARRQIIEPRIVDLNGLVLNVDRMLRRLLGEDVELVTVQDPDLWLVRIDPGQFEQVLVNLAVNARDAMPDGGTLVIETRNVHLDEEFARTHATVHAGPHVLLAVSDTGSGMDGDVLTHIFEPFFTTKEVGKGTGLGLATCYGIVKQNRGSIWVDSEPRIGTTFRIYLPRADVAVVAPSDPADSHAVQKSQGHETVLLVEDEALVRNLAADALRRHGYQVLSAATGLEALDLAGQVLHPIDALVTDVVMPQMGGEQLASRLLAERPGLKVLFISGYTDLAVIQHGSVLAGTALLQKPFTPGQLVQRVRQLLDADPGPSQARLPLTTH
jgi:PAS domain S-box-containing protein